MHSLRHIPPGARQTPQRRGVSAVDYFLAVGVVLPLLLVVIPSGRRMMQLVFELMCTMVAWPFM
jgi:hypothetical protein